MRYYSIQVCICMNNSCWHIKHGAVWQWFTSAKASIRPKLDEKAVNYLQSEPAMSDCSAGKGFFCWYKPIKVMTNIRLIPPFRIETKIGGETTRGGEFTVYRRFKVIWRRWNMFNDCKYYIFLQEFQLLHNKLQHNYTNTCLIVPPPPQVAPKS